MESCGMKEEGRSSPERPSRFVARPCLSESLESAAIFARRDERLDHLGAVEVAAELVELREPEVVAGVVRVRQVVRVALQVAEVLQEDERTIELALLKRLAVHNGAQGRC